MRAVVVGASSGLGRHIGIDLARRGAQTALLARSHDRLVEAAKEAGPDTLTFTCDVTNGADCKEAIEKAAEALGGIDALVYAPGIGTVAALADIDAETWRRILDTNVIGAALVTAAALPFLTESQGTALYLSSVSASQTPPWPGLGSYAVSKAALDKLVEAWRVEYPAIGFTRVSVGMTTGGEGDSRTRFADEWDPQVAGAFMERWLAVGYLDGAFVDVDELARVVHGVLVSRAAIAIPSMVVTSRPVPAS
jgi:NAD(P)-dependent dehydrogenase (short-subunit alcohol dehydrogenase family)